MPTFTREEVEELFRRLASVELDEFCAAYAQNGVLRDPQFPEPQYRGPEAIREALKFIWENVLIELQFSMRNFWASEDTCAVEMDVTQVLQDGSEQHMPQVHVFETRDGLITRHQVYTPFPPPVAPLSRG